MIGSTDDRKTMIGRSGSRVNGEASVGLSDQPITGLPDQSTVSRILIVRLGSMGDVIHALPAASALRSLFPSAQIGWVIEERWVELLCAFRREKPLGNGALRLGPRSREKPLVDRVHIVDTWKWRANPFSAAIWKQMLAVTRELRQVHYEVALDFQGACKSAAVGITSGAPVRVGFREPREQAATLFYTRQVTGQGAHVVEQNLSLLAALVPRGEGIRGSAQSPLWCQPPAPELPWEEGYELWADEELRRHGLRENDFAVINPGAGWGAKCWPAEHYAEVARGLAAAGIKSFINFGPGEEELAQAVETAAQGAAYTRQCSIGELVALMRRARIFVGGDTGPMHLAAALKVPVVAIFGPTDPARNGPYATRAAVLRSRESVTNHSRRAPPDEAMLGITPEMVLTAARELLERAGTGQESGGG
jgi:heptosyltransferase-1